MLTLQYLRSNPDDVVTRLAVKYFDAKEIVSDILKLDTERRQTQTTLDQKLAESNKLSKEIGQLFSQGKKAEAEEKRTQSTTLKEESKVFEDKLKKAEEEIHQLLVRLPNLPNASVPKGKTPEENVV